MGAATTVMKLRSLFRSPSERRRRWRRAFLALCFVPLLGAAVVGMACAYRIYRDNREMAYQESRLPVLPSPQHGQSFLIFSPHPDDETLGAAGLIRHARLAGCDVHIVFMTNGDGFRVGAARLFHVLSPSGADMVRYGVERQAEARTALAVLGVPADHITFLGYPDRGLLPMWTTNWSAQTPYSSSYTHVAYSPYSNSPSPHTPYCGEAALRDVRAQLLAVHPTDIYVTHPDDDHPDHAAASVFVRQALQQLRDQGVPWARAAHLRYFLVHHGDWPVPQGLDESAPLPPPAQMASLDTAWSELPLGQRDIQRKYAAINRYASQTMMTGRFLFSFARRNELFGTLEPNGPQSAPVAPDGTMQIDGHGTGWNGLPPALQAPVADNVVRAVEPGSDITRLTVCRDSQRLYLRLGLRGRVLPEIRYTVVIRPLRSTGPLQPSPISLVVTPGREGIMQPLPDVPGGNAVWRDDHIDLSLPLQDADLTSSDPSDTVYFAARTQIGAVQVDRTGYHALSFTPAPPTHMARR